jgi:hypothetical protein
MASSFGKHRVNFTMQHILGTINARHAPSMPQPSPLIAASGVVDDFGQAIL